MAVRLIPIGTLSLFGCSGLPQHSSVAPMRPALEVKQLMEWVIDPAADVVWESVKTVMTEESTKEIAPGTQEEWDALRNAAALLTEMGNSLMIEGRARDRAGWMSAARRLTDAAQGALDAAQAKDAAAVFAAGGRVYDACSGCHFRYAPHLNADPGSR